MRAVENIFGIDARSELCKSCIHTNVCCKDKNLFGDHFVAGHPMFTDNKALFEKFKEREKDGFPCKDYLHDIVRCKECKYCKPYIGDIYMCDEHGCGTTPDWFCADGERLSE